MSNQYANVPIEEMIQKLKDAKEEEKIKPILEAIWEGISDTENYLDSLGMKAIPATEAIDAGYGMVHPQDPGKKPTSYVAARKKILEMWPEDASSAGPLGTRVAKPPPPSGPPPFRGVPRPPAGPPPFRGVKPLPPLRLLPSQVAPPAPPALPPGPPKAFRGLRAALEASRGQGRKKTAKKGKKSRKTKRRTTRRV